VIEPLCFSVSHSSVASLHPARDLLMLAMASLSKVLIVTLRPDLRVTYVHALYGDAATLPLLAWHIAVDPVLAFARDQTIYLVQVATFVQYLCSLCVNNSCKASSSSP